MSDNSLDTLLPDDQGATQPAAAEPVEPQPSGDTPAAAPPAVAQQEPSGQTVPLATVQDERRKRQELERKVQEYERMLSAQQQRQQQAPPPDWYSEPDQAARVFQQQIAQQMYLTRVHTSQALMRSQKPDYDEMEELFAQEADANPHLWQQLQAHPMPAQFAYEYGRKQKLLREIGDDPDAYRKRVIDEWMAQNGGQPPAASSPPPPAARPKSALPTSLASTRNAPPRDDRGRFQGPASLDELLDG